MVSLELYDSIVQLVPKITVLAPLSNPTKPDQDHDWEESCKMPFDPKAKAQPGRTSFHEILHKVFLDARRNVHLARMAEGTAEWTVKELVQARNNAYTAYSILFWAAKRGELSSSLFKELNDAETDVRELDAKLSEVETTFGAAKQNYITRADAFRRAKGNCEGAGCPQSHAVMEDIPEISREDHMKRKAAKEQ
jgi:hypothetical protein